MMIETELSQSGKILTLTNASQQTRFHAIWLRDNAWDAETRSEDNGQRMLALRDIPAEISIDEVNINGKSLELVFMPENKTIEYELEWLMEHAYDKAAMQEKGWVPEYMSLWKNELMDNLPKADFSDVNENKTALTSWLAKVAKYGFGILDKGPIENGALMQVIDLFGFVRETNYGRHFEVRVEENPINLAFTGAGIQAHTDNPYRDPVPTLQLLYCLDNSAPGGDSMLVDGFAVIQQLRQENAAWFDVLSRYCARFEFSGENGVCLQARRPMIELAPDGQLQALRFNNRSAAAITDVPFDEMELYYEAYRRLGEIADDSSMAISFMLEPGQCVLFDNTRIMHARKAFSGAGSRWLQGCYADKDSLLSKVAAAQIQIQVV